MTQLYPYYVRATRASRAPLGLRSVRAREPDLGAAGLERAQPEAVDGAESAAALEAVLGDVRGAPRHHVAGEGVAVRPAYLHVREHVAVGVLGLGHRERAALRARLRVGAAARALDQPPCQRDDARPHPRQLARQRERLKRA